MTTERHTAVSLLRPAMLAAVSASVVLLAGCADMKMPWSKGGSDLPPTVKVTGGALTDPQGLTLYTFDRDPGGGGKSVCNATCATNWPPLLAEPGSKPTGSYTIITRDDGTRQWAYKGMPLYRFAKDAKAGDRTGDNLNNVWHVAKP